MMNRLLILCFVAIPGMITGQPLNYLPAPVDNPLKGMVPYTTEWQKEGRFPYSMEFRYFGMNEVMKGWGSFDWTAIEEQLEENRSRGSQSILRIYLEYPGRESGIPEFLIKEGLKVTAYEAEGKRVVTPDYGSPLVRRAIKECIAAFGEKYDGDVRLGFITAGMLGHWGEWHTYPRGELFASKEVQTEVMQAFEEAFQKTFVLVRYPAGKSDWAYADTSGFRLGYHDDSFAWATLETGRKEDEWFFVPKLKAAGVTDKWKSVPIGGEVRPEIWPSTFTDQVIGQQQDFARCVRETHVTWLMDSGLFAKRYPLDPARKERALKEVARMGYELHIPEATVEGGELVLTVENRGVAPFYYDWPVELRNGKVTVTDWKLSEVLPGKPVVWRAKVVEGEGVAIRVPNPMEGGRPLRFANAEYEAGWLVIRQ